MTGIFDLARALRECLDEQERLLAPPKPPDVFRGSPYLNRRLRSLDEVLAERAKKERGE